MSDIAKLANIQRQYWNALKHMTEVSPLCFPTEAATSMFGAAV